MTKRSPEREKFLSDLLVTAIEHMSYGFPATLEYKPEPDGEPGASYAVIYDRYEEDEPWDADDSWKPKESWRVDIDTMAKGLGVVRRIEKPANWVRDLLLADRTNGDDGDYDVVGALLVLECAIFGKPMYA